MMPVNLNSSTVLYRWTPLNFVYFCCFYHNLPFKFNYMTIDLFVWIFIHSEILNIKKKRKKKGKIFQTISVITENRTRQKKCSFHLSSYQSLSSVKVSCLNQFFVIETHRQKLSKIFEISQRGQKGTQLK